MEFIQQNLIMIAAAVISGGMLLFDVIRRPGAGNALNTTQATMLINREDAQVIDVREPDEYASGHLPDARNIPLARLEERAAELDKLKDVPLLLVCQTGMRTAGASKTLTKLGFSKVKVLDGGVNAWRTAGLPLKKGTKK